MKTSIGYWIFVVALLATIGCGPKTSREASLDDVDDAAIAEPAAVAQDAAAPPKVEPSAPPPPPSKSKIKSKSTDPLTWQISDEDVQKRLQPRNVVYVGAFRLPAHVDGSSWEYSGGGMTYYPKASPVDDGLPGSLFAIGHDHHQKISEFSIPRPVRPDRSKGVAQQLEQLPTATTLQPFHDIRGGLVGELEIPRAGLEYLESKQDAGKIHFCWGQHFQFELQPSHGWANVTLATPQTQGLWRLGDFTNYVTNDYLFAIPESWAQANLPAGLRLASGRFRDGLWGGRGPAIIAYQPPHSANPPANGAVLTNARTLLMYGRPQAGAVELEVRPEWSMREFRESDEWSGGAWLTHEGQHAVILCGTKGTGRAWYGFSNGVEYPTSGDPNEPVPPVPDFPHDQRGWWSEAISAQLLFFDPAELAAVARGELPSWSPQPYASMSIDQYLFDPGYDFPRQKMSLLGACAFDRDHARLFVMERQVEADEDRSVVHVFQVR